MNIFGIGGPELILILAVALFVLGPARLMEGIREAKRMYTELKRQRDQLQALLEQAVEIEELKKQLEVEKLAEGAKEIEQSLSLDQMVDVEQPAKPSAVRYQRRSNVRPPESSAEPAPDIDLGADSKPAKSDGSTGEARA